MSKKTEIRMCRYWNCPHNREIDLTRDQFHVHGRAYYHPDCWEKREKERQKDETTKSNIKYIRDQWQLHINRSVSMGDLNNCLNELLARGYASDYLVFVMDYVVQHHLNLHWPHGFKYFVDKDFIMAAYANQSARAKSLTVSVDEPKFNVTPVSVGFQQILGGGK